MFKKRILFYVIPILISSKYVSAQWGGESLIQPSMGVPGGSYDQLISPFSRTEDSLQPLLSKIQHPKWTFVHEDDEDVIDFSLGGELVSSRRSQWHSKLMSYLQDNMARAHRNDDQDSLLIEDEDMEDLMTRLQPEKEELYLNEIDEPDIFLSIEPPKPEHTEVSPSLIHQYGQGQSGDNQKGEQGAGDDSQVPSDTLEELNKDPVTPDHPLDYEKAGKAFQKKMADHDEAGIKKICTDLKHAVTIVKQVINIAADAGDNLRQQDPPESQSENQPEDADLVTAQKTPVISASTPPQSSKSVAGEPVEPEKSPDLLPSAHQHIRDFSNFMNQLSPITDDAFREIAQEMNQIVKEKPHVKMTKVREHHQLLRTYMTTLNAMSPNLAVVATIPGLERSLQSFLRSSNQPGFRIGRALLSTAQLFIGFIQRLHRGVVATITPQLITVFNQNMYDNPSPLDDVEKTAAPSWNINEMRAEVKEKLQPLMLDLNAPQESIQSNQARDDIIVEQTGYMISLPPAFYIFRHHELALGIIKEKDGTHTYYLYPNGSGEFLKTKSPECAEHFVLQAVKYWREDFQGRLAYLAVMDDKVDGGMFSDSPDIAVFLHGQATENPPEDGEQEDGEQTPGQAIPEVALDLENEEIPVPVENFDQNLI